MNLVETVPETHRDLGLGEHMLEDRLGDMRLEVEAIRTVLYLRRSGSVLFDVVIVNPREELARIAANGGAIAPVGSAKAAGDHAADVFARFEEDDLFPLACRRQRRDDAAGSGAIDDDVSLDGLRAG